MRGFRGHLDFLEVALEDIELANRLMHEVLGRSLDELPPQTRRFLLLLEEMVRQSCERLEIHQEDYRFYRRDILTFTGWSYNQLRIHMERLLDLEYVLMHRGHQGQRICYELLYGGQGRDGETFCMGLLDVDAIKSGKSPSTMQTLWGQKAPLGGGRPDFVPRLSPDCAPLAGGVLGSADGQLERESGQNSEESLKNAHLEGGRKSQSYRIRSPYARPASTSTGRGSPGNGSGTPVEQAD